MVASDLRRFIDYLGELPGRHGGDRADAEAIKAADVDFDQTLDILNRYSEKKLLRDVLDQSSSLVDSLDHVHSELVRVEGTSIENYIAESDTLVHLHTEIKGCDDTLSQVQNRLAHFHGNLGSVNDEIRFLESHTSKISTKLNNRVKAEAHLADWITTTSVPPDLVHDVKTGQPEDDQSYRPILHSLKEKIEAMEQVNGHTILPAYPVLKDLRGYAVKQTTDFLITKIRTIRNKPGSSPSTSSRSTSSGNASMLKQNLRKYTSYVVFLRGFAPEAYERVKAEYIDVNRRYFRDMVRIYMHQLAIVTKRDEKLRLVIGSDLGAATFRGVMAGMFTPGTQAQNQLDADFDLGTRVTDLLHPDFLMPRTSMHRSSSMSSSSPSTPRTPANQQHRYMSVVPGSLKRGDKIPYEYIFKSLLHQLTELAIGEYTNVMRMFNDEGVFKTCFEWVLQAVESEFEIHLAECQSVVSVLIMARIVSHHELKLELAHVSTLSDFFTALHQKLWPHYAQLMRQQIASVKNDPSGAKARALTTPVPGLMPATERWTSLFISIALLNQEYHDSQVQNNISELARHFISLIYSIQMNYKPSHTGVVFNIINQQYIIAHFKAADEHPIQTLQSTVPAARRGGLADAAEADRAGILDNLELNMELYTRECLNSHVGDMCEYVRQIGIKMKGEWEEGAPVPGLGPDKGKAISENFKSRWTKMLDTISNEVQIHFKSSPDCGDIMLRQCLTLLYKTYERFLEVLNKQGPAGKDVVRISVSLQALRYEFKQQV